MFHTRSRKIISKIMFNTIYVNNSNSIKHIDFQIMKNLEKYQDVFHNSQICFNKFISALCMGKIWSLSLMHFL